MPDEWVLDLVGASRLAAFRSQRQASQRSRLGAWSSRRASARERRRLVSGLLAGPAPAPEPGLEPELLEEAPPEPNPAQLQFVFAELPQPLPTAALGDRIAAYTLSPH